MLFADFIESGGRAEALRVLVDEWEAIRTSSSSRLVWLVGTSGVGKTRIVQEFYAKIAREQRDPVWPLSLVPDEAGEWGKSRRKRVSVFTEKVRKGAGTPDWLWLGLDLNRTFEGVSEGGIHTLKTDLERVYEYLGVSGGASAAARRVGRDVFPDTLAEAGATGMDLAGATVPGFGLIVAGAKAVGREHDRRSWAHKDVELDPNSLGAKDVLDRLKELRRRRPDLPLVLVVEDAHHIFGRDSHAMESGLLTVIMSLLGKGSSAEGELPPTLVIAALMPDGRNDFEAKLAAGLGSAAREIRIEPFDQSIMEGLIRATAPGTNSAIVRSLAEHVHGNPYLLELLFTRELRAGQRGARVHDVDGKRTIVISPEEVGKLPTTVREAIDELWRLLPEDSKFILSVAARLAVERTFDRGLIATVATELEDDVRADRELTVALRSRWIRQLGRFLRRFDEPDRWEIAYQHLDGGYATELALHAADKINAWRRDEARWRERDRATKILLLETHIWIARESRDWPETELVEGLVAEALCSCDALIDEYRGGSARSVDDPYNYLRVLICQEDLAERRGDVGALLRVAQGTAPVDRMRALRLFRRIGNHEAATRPQRREVLNRLYFEYGLAGRFEDAFRVLEQLVREAETPDESRRARERLAEAYGLVGRGEDAVGLWEQLVREAETPDDRSRAHDGLAESYTAVGRGEDAVGLCGQLVREAETPDDRRRAHERLAEAYRRVGRYEDAVGLWEQLVREAETPDDRSRARKRLAEAYGRVGRYEDAVGLWEQLVREETISFSVNRARERLARAYGRVGRYEDAVGLWEQLVREAETPDDRRRAHDGLARATRRNER